MPGADTRTDLRLRQAYTRRGLALGSRGRDDLTPIHEKLVDKLFQEYQREVTGWLQSSDIGPAHCSRPQGMEADE